MTSPPPQDIPFFDVPSLLERSQPRARGGWFWYAAGAFMLVVVVSAVLRNQSSAMSQAMSVLSGFAMIGVVVAMVLLTLSAVRRLRAEQQQLEAIEELVQLRRWPQAAAVLNGMLAEPTRTPQARVQALVYFSSVLARYGRFDDAILVQNHLLDNVALDPSTAYALRLGRAMAMLREDHLFDADRAIAELRRQVMRGHAGNSTDESDDAPRRGESAGLALVEMYRDVKTGHPVEAIEMFQKSLPTMRLQLGHRAGDAYGLLARAHDLLGRETEAQDAYEKATLLTTPSELTRRYPELALLATKYRAAQTPAEVAA